MYFFFYLYVFSQAAMLWALLAAIISLILNQISLIWSSDCHSLLFKMWNIFNTEILACCCPNHKVFLKAFLLLLQELIGKMLQVNVEARYTAQDILSHPWVTVSPSTVCHFVCMYMYKNAVWLLKVPHYIHVQIFIFIPDSSGAASHDELPSADL